VRPSVDDLSVEELERLILVRRREARLAAWQGKALKPARKRRRLATWERLLCAVEITVILGSSRYLFHLRARLDRHSAALAPPH
jgi:hypothetical protein